MSELDTITDDDINSLMKENKELKQLVTELINRSNALIDKAREAVKGE